MWCMLPESVKNCWIQAGKTINTYDDLAKNIPSKVCKILFSLVIFYVILLLLHFRLLNLVPIHCLQMVVLMDKHQLL